ncbi:MAG TPA: 2-C-methyl-D-erythritol 4-phosphate cytidylyltransferase [Ktedonobacterales bacterium]|nr:2-C-methyl-D-erythritol 4-phosphate cytidylyltransferase [Ktedonobacterales bacterium]
MPVDTYEPAGAIILASSHPTPALLWTPIAGRPLLAWSVAACARTAAIAEIVLLVSGDRLADAQALVATEGWTRGRVLAGGARVRDCVEAGLRALDASLKWVVIHEAARPLITAETVAAMLDLAQAADVDVVMGGAVKETVKRLDNGLVEETLPRERLVRAQTPNIFRRERLVEAHVSLPAEREFADEAALALAAGLPLYVFPAPIENIRVISSVDVAVVEALLASQPT